MNTPRGGVEEEPGEVAGPSMAPFMLLTRSERKWRQCALVTEAARYQRRFYDKDGYAKAELIRTIQESRGATCRGPASSIKFPVRKRNTQLPYSLVAPGALKNLIADVRILMAPGVTPDHSMSVANQLWRLGLFSSSRFPGRIDLSDTPSSTSSQEFPQTQ